MEWEILEQVLIKSGFRISSNEEDAKAGWYHCGSNVLNINKLWLIAENINSLTLTPSQVKET